MAEACSLTLGKRSLREGADAAVADTLTPYRTGGRRQPCQLAHEREGTDSEASLAPDGEGVWMWRHGEDGDDPAQAGRG